MPSQSGEDRLVPAPCWSTPLSFVISSPLPVNTSPDCAATSGTERHAGPRPGTKMLPASSVRQFVGAVPTWYWPAGSEMLLPPPLYSQPVSLNPFGGLPPSLFSTVPPTATAYGLTAGNSCPG